MGSEWVQWEVQLAGLVPGVHVGQERGESARVVHDYIVGLQHRVAALEVELSIEREGSDELVDLLSEATDV